MQQRMPFNLSATKQLIPVITYYRLRSSSSLLSFETKLKLMLAL